MERWVLHGRVRVNACDNRTHDETVLLGGVTGTVVRLLRRDDSAWISLDERQEKDVHPFVADDEHGRGTHVLAWPEDCDELEEKVG